MRPVSFREQRGEMSATESGIENNVKNCNRPRVNSTTPLDLVTRWSAITTKKR